MQAFILVIAVVALLIPTPALAYLDPGTGSMILQLVLAGVAGLAVTLKVYWNRIKMAFGRQPQVQASSTAADETAAPQAEK